VFPKFKGLGLRRYVNDWSDNGINLLSKMLTLDPEKRITCEEALKHPYWNE
jgi:cell division cycle 2-like protein